ncbi:MAG: late competence development ComFB family protein [Spirochaetaceae bacterium]|jgi:competence protein ComFB|nr:late competence development ComFB family protein [Spirochaetaceae bacterium]
MDIHNTIEDIVLAQVAEICDSIEKERENETCTCPQCRMDAACYALNRSAPHYIVSNRGVVRVEQESIEHQQRTADIATLVYEGIRRVNHNQRPNFNHSIPNMENAPNNHNPMFNIPTIVGRLFNGVNFAPIADVTVELRRNGDLVQMKDANWQNPYSLIPNTLGTFTFWPTPIPAEGINIHKTFEYSIKVEAPGFEVLHHFFNVPAISEYRSVDSFSMGRTFKLPDLYLFPPGGEGYEDFPE